LNNYGVLQTSGLFVNAGTVNGALTLSGGDTLSDSGMIDGRINFTGGGTLQMQQGGAISGVVDGGGGSLAILGGSGTISGLGLGGAVAGTATANGASFAFSDFTAMTIGANAAWRLSGPSAINTAYGFAINGQLTTDALAVSGSGTLAVSGTAGLLQVRGGMTLENATLSASGGAGIELGAAGGAAANAVTVDAGNTLAGYGTVAEHLIDNGTVVVENGMLTLGAFTGTGTLDVYAGATFNSTSSSLTSGGTVVNAGTIETNGGAGGTALTFGGGTTRLVIDPGAVFVGNVNGGAGASTLELAAGGAGVLTGLGTAKFSNFGAVVVDQGAAWSLTGSNTVAAGTTLTDNGALTASGTLVNAGTVNGPLTVAAGSTLSDFGTINGVVTFAGGGMLQLQSTGAINGSVNLGGGTLDIVGGTGTISGLTDTSGTVSANGSTFGVSNIAAITVEKAASWQLAGAGSINTANGAAIFGKLSGTSLNLDGGGMLTVSGSSASLQMLSGLTLQGTSLTVAGNAGVEVGKVGVLTKNAVTVDAGNTMSGSGTVAAAVIDNGTVSALGGTLAVTGKLSGSGTAVLGNGAVLSSQGALAVANVTFGAGSAGQTLVLGTTAGDTSVIAGFGGGDTIDVQHVTLASLSFAAGKLKLMDGSGVVKLTLSLSGTYTKANFALASDGQGGTDVLGVGLPALMAMARPAVPTPAGASHFHLTPQSSHASAATWLPHDPGEMAQHFAVFTHVH